jgi:siroheme synthase
MSTEKPVAGGEQSRPVEIVPGSSTPTLYANNVQIELSNLDVRFKFGQVQGNTADGKIQVKELLQVYMTHEHLRSFARSMDSILAILPRLQAANVDAERKG